MIRTETKTFKIYNFEDLNKEAQEKAIEKQREFEYENNDQSWIIHNFEENYLKDLGFSNPKTYYSGFNSQGDGACFIFDNLDLKTFLEKNKIKSKFPLLYKYNDEIYLRAQHECNHYYHEKTISVYSELDNLDVSCSRQNQVINAIEKQLEAFESWFEEWRIEECKKIYKELKEDFYYVISDKAIKENIIANEYDFNEDGTMYY